MRAEPPARRPGPPNAPTAARTRRADQQGRAEPAEPTGARRRRSGTGRDRRGRGLRRPLLPPGVPAATSRAEQFDQSVLHAVAELEDLWGERLAVLEFAVDEVPALPPGDVPPSSDVVLDGGVPLSRFVPPGVDRRGRPTRSRVVIYRRPVEGRAADEGDLDELILQVLTEQVAAVFGEPDDPMDE